MARRMCCNWAEGAPSSSTRQAALSVRRADARTADAPVDSPCSPARAPIRPLKPSRSPRMSAAPVDPADRAGPGPPSAAAGPPDRPCQGNDDLVDRIGRQEHLDAAAAQGFQLRRERRASKRSPDRRVMRSLTLRATAGDLGRRQPSPWPLVRNRQISLSRGALSRFIVESLLERGAKCLPEPLVGRAVRDQTLRQFGQHAAGQLAMHGHRQPIFLDALAGNVERQVRAVHQAADKAQILRHQVPTFVHDEDPPGVRAAGRDGARGHPCPSGGGWG